MPSRIVQSKQNARLKELRRALANPGRDESGLVGIEGPNLLEEALRAGLHIACVFAAQGAERLIEALPLPPEIDVLLMPRELLDAALATETPQPIAALIEPPDWTWAHLLPPQRQRPVAGDPEKTVHQAWSSLVVVLAGLQDPGNLGTILRSAEAFGADGVLCLPGTVSAWNQKAVRASAGSVFRLPLLCATETDAMAHLRQAGVRILAATVRGAQPADLANLAGPVALIVGNEGSGVPADLIAHADGAITIPCPGSVESLNAAVAASVLLYEASRQRAIQSGGPQDNRGGLR
jgi:RNA methyltransferase, TrmH family